MIRLKPCTPKDILERSVICPGFEKLKRVPVNRSDKKLRKERKCEREKTTGSNWYNLPATKKTEDVRKDLEILKMRSALDAKHFYKRNDCKTLPKYFQIGRVVDSPADFYSSRIPQKERKRTLVDELMVDAEFKQYSKRKYQEILSSDPKRRKKAHKHAKRLKKLKKK